LSSEVTAKGLVKHLILVDGVNDVNDVNDVNNVAPPGCPVQCCIRRSAHRNTTVTPSENGIQLARTQTSQALLDSSRALSHKSDPRGEIALRRGRTSATLVDLTLVLWTPGPIRSHREEFLPEGLRAYGRPLYENSMFLVRR
jgi:hypothetical protein